MSPETHTKTEQIDASPDDASASVALPDAKNNIIFAVAVFACFSPIIFGHMRSLWNLDHYQYAPLLLLGFPLLVASQRGEFRVRSHRFWPEITLFTVGGFLLLLASLDWINNLAAIGMIVVFGGMLIHFRRLGRLTNILALAISSLFLVRLPGNLDLDLIYWLQGFTSKFASGALDALRIDHVLLGHLIQTSEKSFEVEEACSGIQSLFALLAATAIGLIFTARGWFHSLLLFVSAVFWACMINSIRVTLVVLSEEWLSLDITEGAPHEALGLILFAVALGLMLSTDQLLLFLLMPSDLVDIETANVRGAVKSTQDESIDETVTPEMLEQERELYGASRKLLRNTAIAFAVLFVMQVGILGFRRSNQVANPMLETLLTEQTMPAEFGGWKQSKFAPVERKVTSLSKSWQYEREDGSKLMLSFDYPFLGWHELPRCYYAQGCIREDGAKGKVFAEGNYEYQVLLTAKRVESHLLYRIIEQDGTLLERPEEDRMKPAYWSSRLVTNFRPTATYQIQAYVLPATQLTEDDQKSIVAFYEKFHQEMVAALKKATSE